MINLLIKLNFKNESGTESTRNLVFEEEQRLKTHKSDLNEVKAQIQAREKELRQQGLRIEPAKRK